MSRGQIFTIENRSPDGLIHGSTMTAGEPPGPRPLRLSTTTVSRASTAAPTAPPVAAATGNDALGLGSEGGARARRKENGTRRASGKIALGAGRLGLRLPERILLPELGGIPARGLLTGCRKRQGRMAGEEQDDCRCEEGATTDHRIVSGVPIGSSFASFRISSFRIRMHPCETRPGSSEGRSCRGCRCSPRWPVRQHCRPCARSESDWPVEGIVKAC